MKGKERLQPVSIFLSATKNLEPLAGRVPGRVSGPNMSAEFMSQGIARRITSVTQVNVGALIRTSQVLLRTQVMVAAPLLLLRH